MYEQFKNEFMLNLMNNFSTVDIDKILMQLDMVAVNYTVTKTCTELVVYKQGLPQLCEQYLAVKAIGGFSKGTLDGYRLVLTNFFQETQLQPNEITANHVRVYLYKYQQQRNVSNATLERIRICLHTFYEWLVNEEYMSKNPINKVEKIKCEKKQKHALNPIELEYIRHACMTMRETALVEFFFSTGCRVGELTILKRNDVDWASKEVHLFGKGKKHRVSYLNAKAELTLKEYLINRHDDNEYLFISERGNHPMTVAGIERVIQKISQRANINTPCSPHVFRHTCATIALKNGMPIEEIKELLGHENISTTNIYAETNKTLVKLDHGKFVV